MMVTSKQIINGLKTITILLGICSILESNKVSVSAQDLLAGPAELQ